MPLDEFMAIVGINRVDCHATGQRRSRGTTAPRIEQYASAGVTCAELAGRVIADYFRQPGLHTCRCHAEQVKQGPPGRAACSFRNCLPAQPMNKIDYQHRTRSELN
jgi:DNA-binding transcriptional regulator YdaS (Cro superfamily)